MGTGVQKEKAGLKGFIGIALIVFGGFIAFMVFAPFPLVVKIIFGTFVGIIGLGFIFVLKNKQKELEIAEEFANKKDPEFDALFEELEATHTELYSMSRLQLINAMFSKEHPFEIDENTEIIKDDSYKKYGMFWHAIKEFHIKYRLKSKHDGIPFTILRYTYFFERDEKLESKSGFVFQSEFNKHFQHQTLVMHDYFENSKVGGIAIGRRLFKKHISKSYQLEEVLLEDPVFEKQFIVMGQDQIESRFLLSLSMMERFKEMVDKVGNVPSVAFKDNTISLNLEDKDWQSKHISGNFKLSLKSLYRSTDMLFKLTDTLKLNQEIWKKMK